MPLPQCARWKRFMQPVCNRRPNYRQTSCSEETLALLESALLEGLTESGGEGGIRTPDRGVSPYNGLANRRLQPLGHLSGGYAASSIVSASGLIEVIAALSSYRSPFVLCTRPFSACG